MDKIEVGEIFTIIDEEEKEHAVEVLAQITLTGTDYIAVSFLDDVQEDTDEDIDIYFMKIDEAGDLAVVESDEEFVKVSKAFDDILNSEE